MKDVHTRTDGQKRRELGKADFALAVVFLAVAFAMRVPFRSQFAYQWDSAQFALAVGEYNIRISQPHAPGFYLYVMLGRLINLLVGEPHAALVWLSVIAGSWLVGVGYLLATSMFGRRCGWATALILLTSPLSWFHSEVALTNIVDTALVVTFVFICWRAMQEGVTWSRTVALAALFAAIAGVRQQTAVLLIPLSLYVFWGFARSQPRKLACATLLAIGLSPLWFVPTMESAGGFAPYLELLHLKSRFDSPRTIWGGGGIDAALTDISWMGRTCWVGLWLAGIIAVVECLYWAVFEQPAVKNVTYRTNASQLCTLALWLVPMVLFGIFAMYVALPGHILDFFPAVVVLVSLALGRFADRLADLLSINRTRAYSVVLAMVVAVNVVVFVWSPAPIIPLFGTVALTGMEISEHDAVLSACFQTIRKNWPSKNVTVCHQGDNYYWGFRQFEYHLPEYHNVLFSTDASLPGAFGKDMWLGYQRQTTFQREVVIPTNQDVVLFVNPTQSLDSFKAHLDLRHASLLMDSGVKLYLLHY